MIGVMGGMGPAAALQFGRQLMALQDGDPGAGRPARLLLDQATDIPDRTAAILGTGPTPLPAMSRSLQRLHRGGAELVAVTCNTAHHFFDDLQHTIDRFGLGLTLLHIVDASMTELRRLRPDARRVGLLATTGTLDSGIYQRRAAALGIELTWVTPDPAVQAGAVMAGIYDGVKAGDVARGRTLLLEAANDLRRQGVDAVLLACTEIPLVLHAGDLAGADGQPIPFVDTLGALAREALATAHAPSNPPATPAEASGAEAAAQARSAPHATEAMGGYRVGPALLSAFVQAFAACVGGRPARPRRLGVVGGTGGHAGLHLAELLVARHPTATRDQHHLGVTLDQSAHLPDLSEATRGGSVEPADEIGRSVHRLLDAGADDIVLACHAAHPDLDALRRSIRLRSRGATLHHAVDTALVALDRQAPAATRVGLLGTPGALAAGIDAARASGRTRLLPAAPGGAAPEPGHGDPLTGTAALRASALELVADGAQAVLLGPIGSAPPIRTGELQDADGRDIPVIDILEAQAQAAIDRSRLPRPATPGIVARVGALLAPVQAALSGGTPGHRVASGAAAAGAGGGGVLAAPGARRA